jgi:hypothetical protein
MVEIHRTVSGTGFLLEGLLNGGFSFNSIGFTGNSSLINI